MSVLPKILLKTAQMQEIFFKEDREEITMPNLLQIIWFAKTFKETRSSPFQVNPGLFLKSFQEFYSLKINYFELSV